MIRSMKDPLNLRARQIVVQFPFSAPSTEEKTEEELARIAERRKEQGRKLQEIAAKARMEKVSISSTPGFARCIDVFAWKLVQKETDLQNLTNLKDKRDEENKKEWAVSLIFVV